MNETTDMTTKARIRREGQEIERAWAEDPRWHGIERPYSGEDVVRLRGSLRIEHTLGRVGAERLWRMLSSREFVAALGALTGGQAVEMLKAGLDAIYLSGWQVAADANLSGQTYPDQSLYPANSVPSVVRRLNNAMMRADQISWAEGHDPWFLPPIVADAEAGFGGPLNAFELMKAMIEAGASGVHFEDQLASEKKCGHLGGKVLVPTEQFIRTLTAARLAADVLDVPTIVIARTDALAANLLTTDIDKHDVRFTTGERTPEGFFRVRGGHGRGDRARPGLCTLRGHVVVRDVDPGPAGGPRVRGGHPLEPSRQAARLQLLTVVQLETAPRRRRDRTLPAGAGRHGLPVPVHHARRVPLAERRHVRAGARLCRGGHERLRAAAGARVRAGGRGLHRDPSPGRGRAPATSTWCRRSSRGGTASTLALKGSTEEEQFSEAAG